MSIEGTDHKIERVVKVTDGDTLRVVMHTREIRVSNERTMRLRTLDEVRGEPIRLVTLDTPERGTEGYTQAKADVEAWVVEHEGRLRGETYESAGWDRLLGDVYVEGERGNTLTQYMLLRGWDPYVPPRA